MSGPLPIASFKLQFTACRVRIVPARGERDEPFAGPGIDLLGDETRRVFALSRPLREWFEQRNRDVIRSLSFDVLDATLLVTVEDRPRPRVLRLDRATEPAAAEELLLLAAPLIAHLGAIAREKLVARRSGKEP